MDRRNFLRTLASGTAAAVAVRTFPFRTYFFPKSAPILKPNDFLVVSTDYGYEPGQLVACYDSSGGLAKGTFRVVSVDSKRGVVALEFVPGPHIDLLGRPVLDERAYGKLLGLSRAKYPGRLTEFPNPVRVRTDHVDRVMAQFKSDLDTLTDAFEPKTLAFHSSESRSASWKRKLFRA